MFTRAFHHGLELASRQLPPALRDGSLEDRRRGLVLVLFSVALACWGPFYTVVFGSVGFLLGPLCTGIGTFTVLATIPLLRRTGSPWIAGNWLAGQLYWIVTGCLLEQGGLQGMGLAWYAAVPLFAYMVSGRRSGLFWTAAVLLGIFGFAVASALDWVEPHPLTGLPWILNESALLAGVTCLIATLATLYEHQYDMALQRIQQAEAEARAAHVAAQRMLDNVGEGMTVIGADGAFLAGRSATFERWFGEPREGETLYEMLELHDEAFAEGLELGLEQLSWGTLPQQVALAQLPDEMHRGRRVLTARYDVLQDEPLHLLVTLGDVTAQRAAAQARAQRDDILALLHHSQRDLAGVRSFLLDGTSQLAVVRRPHDVGEGARALHTLKGNAGVFEMRHLQELAHAAERALAAGANHELRPLFDHWAGVMRLLSPLFASGQDEVVVERVGLQAALEALPDEPEVAAQVLQHLLSESTGPHLERLAQAAQGLARRLGRSPLQTRIDDAGVRVDGTRTRALWSSLVHVVRNAVDHGIEPDAERLATDKPVRGTLSLSTGDDGHRWWVEIRDDGRGLDVAALADAGARLGLEGVEATTLALRAGLTTRSEATMFSGRGEGLAAVQAEAHRLGGRVVLSSSPGRGTTVRVEVPRAGSSSNTTAFDAG
jgi:HPt (histidine-containing phosphotransfer) domain-containing protein